MSSIYGCKRNNHHIKPLESAVDFILFAILFIPSAMPEDNISSVPFDDPEMLAAVTEARSTVQQFVDALCFPKKGQKSFLMKVAFTENDDVEHIWLADLDFAGSRPSGVVANEPRIKSLKFMQVTEFSVQQVTDWMYVDHGVLVGGYTTRLLRKRIPLEERKAYDARAPYKFE